MDNEEKNFQSVKDSVKELMTEIEKHNNIKAIFGEPVREKDVVIVPVGSVAMSGGGGGGGGQPDKDGKDDSGSHKLLKGWGSGMGIGYARKVKPIGYIEIRDGKTSYKPIIDAGKISSVAIAAGLAGATILAMALLKKKKNS